MLTKKLIKETAGLVRIRLFLNECGLSRYDIPVRTLKVIRKALRWRVATSL